ncbi:immune inhibitor A [candidate division TA06 bacterium]|nr:immune inhibitor A [candidate division TA06 bacterium]
MSKWLVVLALVVLAANAFAIPANPRPRTLTQPDGSKFQATLKGDEHFHFAETADGYSIVQNEKGYWTYAKQENGLLVATNLVVGKSACDYALHLRPSADAVQALPQNAGKVINFSVEKRHKMSTDFLYGKDQTKLSAAKAASGRQYMNVVLGDFSDSTFAWYAGTEKAGQNPYTPFPYDHTAANNHNLALTNWFNFLAYGDSISPYVPDSSIVGSMSNFYKDFTMNKCWWFGSVSAVVATGITRLASVSADAPSSTYYTPALNGADATVDYDNDNNGVADGLILVHPGPGQEESSDTKDIWSMSMTGSFGTRDGVTITELIACPQNGQLGVFCHEMFHQIGGPDLYDYGYSGTPWGEWSLMDNGSYNGNLGGDKPAFPGGHLQYDVDGHIETGVDGWLTAGAVGNTDSISSLYRGDGQYTICALDSAGEARRGHVTSGIRLWRVRNNAFRDSAQVFLVELRNRTPPYEEGLPENGIIVTHLDTRMGGGSRFNDGPPTVKYYYSWVEQPGINPNTAYAAGDSLFPRQCANAAYSAQDVSPGGYAENAIDSLTIPNCKTNRGTGNGGGNGPWIYDVSDEGPTMTFKVARTGLAAATPLVGYQSSVVLDPVLLYTANNNNSIFDPWEYDSVKVTLRNTGVAITAGAACSLYVVDGEQWATVTNPGWKAVGGGAIVANGSGQSLSFAVAINKDAPKFFDITFAVAFRSTTPAYNTISYFTQRISGLVVVKTYDFQNLRVGGTTWDWRIMPSSVAVLADTVFVSNANLDHATFSSRLYAVGKNTTNNPLLPADTIRSINNRGSVHVATKYAGGIDIDNSGQLWISLQDSVYGFNRSTTVNNFFRAPNVSWGGTPMLRIRGVAFGPAVIDTIGPDPISGDSLWVYWQNYEAFSESLMLISKPASGTAVKRAGYSWDETAYGASYGGQWWNGRALENDGSSIWTSSVFMNYLMRRNPTNGQLVDIMPGPSTYGSYGTYGMAMEATNSAGVPYAPVGTAAYVPYAVGNRHYLYCASMDEAKVYKIDITGLVGATPPDSVKVTTLSATSNKIKWFKANVDKQKVFRYNLYRQVLGSTTPPTSGDLLATITHRYGAGVADSFIDNSAKGGKAAWVYTVTSSNYYTGGSWGASVNADAKAVELTSFAAATSNNSVTLNWATASELNNYQWIIKRSVDGVNYQDVATLDGAGTNPYGKSYSHTDVVEAEGIYYYQLYNVNSDGHQSLSGQLIETVGKIPVAYELSQNYPNPVGRNSTKVAFALKNPGKVSLVVYNVLGEQVKTLANDTRKAGFYTVTWNGTDDNGRQVSNGIYFYKLISGEFQSTKKLTVLK